MSFVPPTVDEFALYLGTDNDEEGLQDAIDVSVVLVDLFIASGFREGSQTVYSNEVLKTAKSVLDQSKSTGGTQLQMVDQGSMPVRAPRDPLTSAYPTLRKVFGVLPF